MKLSELAAPFPPEAVSWRVGSTTSDKKKGMALAYIDARDVMARLDEVCGPNGWQRRYPWSDGKRLCCEIGIKIGDEWIWKSDGAGESDVEAEKGAFSDAFKRAAVSWGVGRYLYDIQSPWVALEPAGKSFKIMESELPKLRAVLGGRPAPKPEPEPKIAKEPPRRLPAPLPNDPAPIWKHYAAAVSAEAKTAPNRDWLVKFQAANAAGIHNLRETSEAAHSWLADQLNEIDAKFTPTEKAA